MGSLSSDALLLRTDWPDACWSAGRVATSTLVQPLPTTVGAAPLVAALGAAWPGRASAASPCLTVAPGGGVNPKTERIRRRGRERREADLERRGRWRRARRPGRAWGCGWRRRSRSAPSRPATGSRAAPGSARTPGGRPPWRSGRCSPAVVGSIAFSAASAACCGVIAAPAGSVGFVGRGRAAGGDGPVRGGVVVARPGPQVGAVADQVGLAELAEQGEPLLVGTAVPDPHGVRAGDQRGEAGGVAASSADGGQGREPEVGGLDDGAGQGRAPARG